MLGSRFIPVQCVHLLDTIARDYVFSYLNGFVIAPDRPTRTISSTGIVPGICSSLASLVVGSLAR